MVSGYLVSNILYNFGIRYQIRYDTQTAFDEHGSVEIHKINPGLVKKFQS